MKRADGIRVKNADPMYTVAAYIMDKRYDAMNMITLDIPIDPIHKYLHNIRKTHKNISHLGIIIAAYLRTAAEFPLLNRFIVNKRAYARTEFPVGMVVLKAGKLDSGTMSKVYFELEDDLFTVQKKMDNYIEANRKTPDSNSTEKLIKALLKIPGLVGFGVGLFKWMDKHGLLPKSIINASPFHASLVISNLASIRTNHIYHHCYEFGTTSVFITMGNLREVPKRVGEDIVFERCMPLGVVMDERICSGSYFAHAFRKFKKYLADPSLLEIPPSVVNKDENI